MASLNIDDVRKYVETNIATFHSKRIDSLTKLKLTGVLKRKNPYLFKAKYVMSASEIVKGIVDAHISSNEETIFGDWIEGLAIFINGKVYGGWKSGIYGVDLEFDRDGTRFLVNIKSGPNWGNSSAQKKMILDFKSAARTLRTSNSGLSTVFVNGICYGQESVPDKGHYFKYCGQDFWTFISGDSSLYINIIEPLGHLAKERNDDFLVAYNNMLNKFTLEFSQIFCDSNGSINWNKLVEFNSGKRQPNATVAKKTSSKKTIPVAKRRK
ncbi:MAG: cytosolic protein [Cyclobacteriaceae bacterium]|nr:cytosolic protein [Cyclobacteriaceae bacterium]